MKDNFKIFIEKFILYLRERNFSVETIRAYRTDLEDFARYANTEFPDRTISRIDKLAYGLIFFHAGQEVPQVHDFKKNLRAEFFFPISA